MLQEREVRCVTSIGAEGLEKRCDSRTESEGVEGDFENIVKFFDRLR